MTDLEDLLTTLVACDSTNPELVAGGAGETTVAELVGTRLAAAGLEVEVWDAAPGRASVLGVLPGSGGGRSLLLCSHLDVVADEPSGFRPHVHGGRLHGRGASDMKGGLAAAIVAAERLAADGVRPRGDVLVAGVIDEEWLSAGAIDLVARLAARGRRVDAAILPEATGLDLVIEHGGFAWWEVHSAGVEAAGDDPDRGVDAIALLGPVLTGLIELDAELATRPAPPYGRPSVHASTIVGGRHLPAYAASCRLGIERCTVPGETTRAARAEIEAILAAATAAEPRFSPTLRVIVEREAIAFDASEPIVGVLAEAASAWLGAAPESATRSTYGIARAAGPSGSGEAPGPSGIAGAGGPRAVRLRGDVGWMDSGVLVEAGIPCVAFGPTGDGEHTGDEWVDLASVAACADVLEVAARAFCDGAP
jgi:acetylornithine deacetylase